jgi:hypothetical protein
MIRNRTLGFFALVFAAACATVEPAVDTGAGFFGEGKGSGSGCPKVPLLTTGGWGTCECTCEAEFANGGSQSGTVTLPGDGACPTLYGDGNCDSSNGGGCSLENPSSPGVIAHNGEASKCEYVPL